VLFTVALLIALAVTVLTVRVLFAVFAGVLFAIVLHAVASFAAKHTRLPYPATLATLVVVLLGGFVAGVVLLAPSIAEEFAKLREALPPAVHTFASSLGYGDFVDRMLGKGGAPGSEQLQKVAAGAAATVGTTFELLAGGIVCFFTAIYGAADPKAYERAVLALVPEERRPVARSIMTRACHELERWLLGRLVAMLFVGVACAIAFLLLHVPLAIPLAVLAGLLTFVEYFGAIASAIPAVLLAFSEGPLNALWVGVVFTGLHVIEGYVLTPLLAKNAVRLPPALTLVGQAVFGALVGAIGLTFSTPLLVVAVVAGKEWRKQEREPRAA
jgi:predicted PurR-regulated permease PerM